MKRTSNRISASRPKGSKGAEMALLNFFVLRTSDIPNVGGH
jgi:hypothetical protein